MAKIPDKFNMDITGQHSPGWAEKDKPAEVAPPVLSFSDEVSDPETTPETAPTGSEVKAPTTTLPTRAVEVHPDEEKEAE